MPLSPVDQQLLSPLESNPDSTVQIEGLLEQGANLNTVSSKGTALHAAVRLENAGFVNALLDLGV